MIERLLAITSVALIAYIVADKWQQQRSIERVVDFHKSSLDNLKKLRDHSNEFNKPEVLKVADGIHVAIGFALANSILLEGPDGAVIIDTVESVEAASTIYAEFRKVTSLPIRALVYTHNHQDHVGGASAFLEDLKMNKSVEIWAHESFMDIYRLTNHVTGPIIFKRAYRQFGVFIERENTPNSGIGHELKLGTKESGFVPPNRFLKGDSASVTIGGIPLKLIHIPGETDDQIAVYWPEKRALFCADDVYKAFPNLYAIRGTPFRSLQLWTNSLDKMRALDAEFLVPSHTRPVVGEKAIRDLLTAYRDAVQIVHDQAVRLMNAGFHPDEIASKIRLPPSLERHEFLQEFYGTVQWSAKGLFAGYLGWFSGFPEELSPLTPAQEAVRLVQLAGGESGILRVAARALQEGDTQWALQLSAAALRANAGSAEAREIKAKSLLQLAAAQKSANGYNYYTTCAYEELGRVSTEVKPEARARTIFRESLETLFQIMRYRVNFERCSSLDKLVEFRFTDVDQKIRFHLRNGIVDLINTHMKPQPDVVASLSSRLFRQLLAGATSALLESAAGGIVAEPGLMAFREVMVCFG